MKIIVPSFILPALEEETCALVKGCDFVVIDPDEGPQGDPEGAEVLMLPMGLSDEEMERLLGLPSLRWIHSVTAGVDHALVEALCEQDAVFTNASGVFDLPIGETVLTYIMMIAKRMPEFMAQQREHTWDTLRLREIAGLTVGVVGLGSIGQEVARLCQAVGMRVTATRRHPERGAPHVDRLVATDDLEELLAEADFVVLSLPLTEETKGMFDAERLAQMKPDAWLINVGRGAVVNQEALVTALREGQIAGAALDVFVKEPLPYDSPLWEMEAVIITPHNSWSSPRIRQRQAELFLENLRRYLRDEPLRNVVDKRLGY
jgi:phosphoglycerate dehydrogenase-like enzyme